MWLRGACSRWVVVLVLAGVAGNTEAVCPTGWISLSGKCYKLVTSTVAVNACTCSLRKVCWELGGELVSMETAAEETQLLSIMETQFSAMPVADRPTHLLLGVTDLDTEGSFQWLDGSTVTNARWKPGSPDDGGAVGRPEDCAAIETNTTVWDTANTQWIDISCCFNELAITTTFCEADDDNFTAPATNILADACFGSCPEGWWAFGADRCIGVLEMYGAGFQKIANVRHTCRQHGGDLPVLESQETLDLALLVMRSSNRTARPTQMFLGLMDVDTEGAFVWVDGTSYASGMPMTITQTETAHDENCVMMTSSDDQWLSGSSVIAWEDYSCCTEYSAIFQAICMRRVAVDYDIVEYDRTISECTASPKYYCPRGSFYHTSYEDCYSHFLEEVTYAQAETLCSAHGGSQLLSILDSEESSLVAFAFTGYEVWLGLDDRATEGTWVWADGSPYGSYTNFGTTEPDQMPGDGDCVVLDPYDNMVWNDADCGTPRGFVCKRRNMYKSA